MQNTLLVRFFLKYKNKLSILRLGARFPLLSRDIASVCRLIKVDVTSISCCRVQKKLHQRKRHQYIPPPLIY